MTTEQTPHVTGYQLENLLLDAERLRPRVRREQLSTVLSRAAQVAAVLTGATVSLLLLVAPDRPWTHAALTCLAAGTTVGVIQILWAAPLQRRAHIDEVRMLNDVETVRELHEPLARHEGWDDARLEHTRRRLAAFPLEGRRYGRPRYLTARRQS
ncbi:hypothetical protein [Streptomyces sparsus]